MKTVMLLLAGLALEPLDGNKADFAPSDQPTVLIFWRADCAPCLIELRQATDYLAAAGPGRVLFVGLQDGAALRTAAVKAGLPMAQVARTSEAPEAVLTAFGGAPPTLPLAVALDRNGAVCARRKGLLGTDLMRQWMLTCGGDHAVD